MDLARLVASLSRSVDPTYVLSRERKLVRTNEGWRAFALANQGEEVLSRWRRGACIDDAMTPELRTFYARAYERVLETGQPWFHDYECSSAELFRRFRMSVYPWDPGFLVVVNSLLVEMPHPGPNVVADTSAYEVAGVITACSACRRTRNPLAHQRWDWIPAWVERPPANVSHGLCEACMDFYHPDVPAR